MESVPYSFPVTVESVLLFVLGVVVFIIGLLVSIGLHELGHLSFAKLFNVKVTQYSLGFGKAMWSFKRGETEYGIRPILLGGYISMVGMLKPRASGREITNTGMYSAFVQDARQASAEQIADSGGDDSRAFYRLTPWKRIIVMVAGPAMNLVIGIVLFGVLLCGFGAPTTTFTSSVGCVLPNSRTTECSPGDAVSPAKQAGIASGDVVLSVNGEQDPTITRVSQVFQESAGEQVTVVVDRDGARKTLEITPTTATRDVYDAEGKVVKNDDGTTKTQRVGVVGVSIGQSLVRQSPAAVLPATGAQIAASAHLIIDLPQRLVAVWNAAFGAQERSQDSPVSVVGVGRAIGEVSSMSGVPVVDKAYTILGLLASLNIGLFVLNMVPLLPLDGGHIAGALWEAIKRRSFKLVGKADPGPIDLAKTMPLTMVVVVLLAGMSALLIYADIVRPVNLFG
ncbi:site-2 protease family protein [Curtobacterium sp. VKM Ac-2889]|jgi:membrane-associated protease RseP (regulator of RpoE activity)|nr:peptidase [Curtobacterium sp. Leaf154]MBF4598583.1 site-2 protease family protein [Curtobacterium sp. VKM Ac-1796]MBF4611800.1 site-2 protease family protein [Curtobacterium sp. VKM Ac-2889]TPG09314.1 PDZ domain-containing protein [Curtobacterium flaccumfaciens]